MAEAAGRRQRRLNALIFSEDFAGGGVGGLEVNANVADEDAFHEGGVFGNEDIVRVLTKKHLTAAQQLFKFAVMGRKVPPPIPLELDDALSNKLGRAGYKTPEAVNAERQRRDKLLAELARAWEKVIDSTAWATPSFVLCTIHQRA